MTLEHGWGAVGERAQNRLGDANPGPISPDN